MAEEHALDQAPSAATSSIQTPKTVEQKAADKERAARAKRLAEQVKKAFFSPFCRMMRFLYTGISPRSDVFILGTDSEKKFRYGNPDQGLAVVHLKDEELRTSLLEWFTALGVDASRHELVNVAQISAILNKCKWDMSRISSIRDDRDCLVLTTDSGDSEIVSEPVQTYFAFQKIKQLTESYVSALVNKSVPVYEHPYRGDDTMRLTRVVVDVKQLYEAGFSNLPREGHMRVLLTRGLDWLHVKDLAPCTETDFLGLRLWCPSGSSLFYMHVYDTAEMTLATTRCNFFLIPRPFHPTPIGENTND